jgi:beta-galactosidase
LLSLTLTGFARLEPANWFNNGEVTERVKWLDTDGNLINAHDGGILFVEGKYYWYGMELRPFMATNTLAGGQKTTTGVAMYSSTNLYDWKREGVILPCSNDSNSPLRGPMRFERPKIIYNQATKKYVMWFHYVGYPGNHGEAIGTADAGVATCDTINGHYTFLGFTRPIDEKGAVKDSTLFKDDDGSAYFIYDRLVSTPDPNTGEIQKIRSLHIVKLSDDYLTCTATCKKIGDTTRREAPVMLKHNGRYFLITSGMSGWAYNRSSYYQTTNLLGSYELMGDPCTGTNAATTYDSQGTYAFAVEGKKDQFIFISERHYTPCLTDSSYIFWPVLFPSPTTLRLPYLPKWNTATMR